MSGLRDITTTSAVRVLTIGYLLYTVVPDGCVMLLPRPSVPGVPPHALDPFIAGVLLTLAAAFALMFSYRIGMALTCLTQVIQSFAIMSPCLRYYFSIAPSVWVSLRVSLLDWHVSPWI